jgi:hypothetical protein
MRCATTPVKHADHERCAMQYPGLNLGPMRLAAGDHRMSRRVGGIDRADHPDSRVHPGAVTDRQLTVPVPTWLMPLTVDEALSTIHPLLLSTPPRSRTVRVDTFPVTEDTSSK